MRIKLSIGLILFIIGILLDVVADIAGIWILGIVAGILWPIGMVMGINSLMSLKHEKQEGKITNQLTDNPD